MKQLTNNSFSKQKGFTLIELVVVIVILGILAATAAPKFIDLTGDARKSTMQGVQGSINSAINLAHAKALVSNQTGNTGEVTIGGETYTLAWGYPAKGVTDSDGSTTPHGIDKLIDLDADSDITYSVANFQFTHAQAGTPANCSVTYAEATETSSGSGIIIPAKTTGDFNKC
jgi:MSHA pilin protein MshA